MKRKDVGFEEYNGLDIGIIESDNDNDKTILKHRPTAVILNWSNDITTVKQEIFTGNNGINPVISGKLTNECLELYVLSIYLSDSFLRQICIDTKNFQNYFSHELKKLCNKT